MKKMLSVAVAVAAVVAMSASADAKSKKRHMAKDMSMQQSQQWGWNGSSYMFKGDRYDFSGTYGTAADKARRQDRQLQGKN